jgi:hypothetical protein
MSEPQLQQNTPNGYNQSVLIKILFRICCFAVSQFVTELGCKLPDKWTK